MSTIRKSEKGSKNWMKLENSGEKPQKKKSMNTIRPCGSSVWSIAQILALGKIKCYQPL